jgi:hypothetical protein
VVMLKADDDSRCLLLCKSVHPSISPSICASCKTFNSEYCTFVSDLKLSLKTVSNLIINFRQRIVNEISSD